LKQQRFLLLLAAGLPQKIFRFSFFLCLLVLPAVIFAQNMKEARKKKMANKFDKMEATLFLTEQVLDANKILSAERSIDLRIYGGLFSKVFVSFCEMENGETKSVQIFDYSLKKGTGISAEKAVETIKNKIKEWTELYGREG
jgi:hypothetical protein